MDTLTEHAERQDGQVPRDDALSIARQTLYRFAAWTLVDPRCGNWGHLADQATARIVTEAASLLRNESAADQHSLGLGELPLSLLDPAVVFARLPDNPESLNCIYEQTFGLLVSNNCPPYETEYVNSKFTFQRSHGLADIAGYYRAFGLETSIANPERPDHLALELEFMAFLVGHERAAGARRDPASAERRTVCQQAQRTFLADHLAWWVPTFARLLSEQDPGGFYEGVAKFLAAFIAAERSLAGITTQRGQVTPSTVERPEECSGCMLHGEMEL